MMTELNERELETVNGGISWQFFEGVEAVAGGQSKGKTLNEEPLEMAS